MSTVSVCALLRVACRYDPGTSLQDDIDTPAERMQFLESIAHALFLKARLKLNIKRLYAADGRAVHELLKVTDLLFAASQRANIDAEARKFNSLIPHAVLTFIVELAGCL
jgi:Clusterin-associated protein-1